jgi:methionine-rich copper-binding protein CopC
LALFPHRRHRPTSREAARAADPRAVREGLERLWLNGEGAGPVTDLARGTIATATNAPAWAVTDEGPARRYVAASSQYDALGAISALDGSAAFTWAVRMRRTAAGSVMSMTRGATTAVTTEILLFSDGSVFAVVANGTTNAYTLGTVSGTDWHTLVLVFDGSETGDTNRCRLYDNGALVSMSAGPVAMPATGPTSAAEINIGRREHDALYNSGDWLWAAVWPRRALTAVEVAALDPLALAAPSRRYWPGVTSSARVTFSDQAPAVDAVRVAVIPEIAVTATPTDEGNPIDTASVTIDGEAATVDDAPDGDGTRYTVTPSRPLTPGTHTVEWTVTTDDAVDTVYSYSFTVRAAVPSWVPARALYGVPADAGAIAARAVYGAPASGFDTTVPARAVYSVSQEATGLLNYVAARAVYWATDDARALLVAVSTAPAETTWAGNVGLGANVEATVKRVAAQIGAALGGSRRADLVAIGLGLEKDERATLIALGLDPGDTTWAGVPLGATVRAVVARLLAEYDTVSELQQEIEEEP